MIGNNFYPKIMFPIRLYRLSATLIDNIFCKIIHNANTIRAGILYTKISYHFPCFACIVDSTENRSTKSWLNGYKYWTGKTEHFKWIVKCTYESRLDKSPTTNPNANYDKIHKHLKDLTENTSRIAAWSLTSMYTNGQNGSPTGLWNWSNSEISCTFN